MIDESQRPYPTGHSALQWILLVASFGVGLAWIAIGTDDYHVFWGTGWIALGLARFLADELDLPSSGYAATIALLPVAIALNSSLGAALLWGEKGALYCLSAWMILLIVATLVRYLQVRARDR